MIVEVNANWLGKQRLDEGIWKQSEYPDYYYRVDAARPEMKLRRHITIAHKKHLRTASKQVSWNDDLSRHDKSTFADDFKGMEKAKEIARGVLNLSDDTVLESVSDLRRAKLLVESALEENECLTRDVLEVPILILKERPLTTVERAVQILKEMDKDSRKPRH